MSHAESILTAMEPDKVYTAKELAEVAHKPVETIYAALREVENTVIVREKVKPEKGRSYLTFCSKQ